MVDSRNNNDGRDGHAAYNEDIRDRHLLPEETNLRKSVKYGAAGLIGLLAVGVTGKSCNQNQEIQRLSQSEASLQTVQGDLDASNSKIAGYEEEIAKLKAAAGDQESAVAEWQAKVEALEATKAEQEAALSGAADLQAKIDEQNNAIAELEAIKAASVEEIEALRAKSQEGNSAASGFEAEIGELTTARDALQVRVDEIDGRSALSLIHI